MTQTDAGRISKIMVSASLLFAGATLSGAAPAMAQNSLEASVLCQGPEAPWPSLCQSPEGSWLYTVTLPNPGGAPIVFQGVETYAAGGGYSEADQLSFTPGYFATAGHGAWRSTGPGTFLLTYLNLTYDASGNPTGSGKVRQTTTMNKNGTSYSGSGDFFYYDLNGNTVASGTFTITATRIMVQKPH